MTRVRNSLRNHWVIMAACCLVPLAVLVAIVGFGVPVTAAALVGLALICPVAHLALMRGMAGHGMDRLTAQSTDRPANQPINRLTNQLSDNDRRRR